MSGSFGFIGHDSAAQVAVVQDPLIARLGPIVELSSGSPDVRVAIIEPVDAGALGQARLCRIRSTRGVDDKTSHVACDHGTAVVELLAAPGSVIGPGCKIIVHPILRQRAAPTGISEAALVRISTQQTRYWKEELVTQQPASRTPRLVRLPGFVTRDEDVGLGDDR
jgi:hypothetical protein